MRGLALAIFALVVALVNAALVRKSDDDFSLVTREIAESNTHIVLGTLPDGRRRIALYDNEEYLGAIEEGPGGEFDAIVYDPYGNVVDIDDEVDEEVNGEDNKLKIRQAALVREIVRRLAAFIRVFGSKAWVSHSLEICSVSRQERYLANSDCFRTFSDALASKSL